jgi:hypothetical protein
MNLTPAFLSSGAILSHKLKLAHFARRVTGFEHAFGSRCRSVPHVAFLAIGLREQHHRTQAAFFLQEDA